MWRTKHLIVPSVLLFILAIAGARAFAQEKGKSLLEGDPVHGRAIFVSKGCIECHSVRHVGGTVGPDLGLKVFNKTVYEIAGILWNHSPFMSRKMEQLGVRRPQFTSVEMLDLVSFLYFMNYFDPPGDVQLGRQLWVEKKCSTCHSLGNEEEKVGPRLDRMQSPLTSVSLAQGMWNHGTQMLEMLRSLRIEPPTFRGTEMVDLVAYVRQLNRNPRRQFFSLGDPHKGEILFRSKGCSSCHSATSGGPAPDLRGSRFQASVSQIAGQMWNHLPQMKRRMGQLGIRFPTFSGEEMNHLISYIYSLAYVGQLGDPKRGAAVFEQKRCVSCHGLPGKKEQKLGPDLATVAMDSPLGVIPAMWNHAIQMEGKMKEKQVAWPRFDGSEMTDLQAYLMAAHKKTTGPH